MVCDVVNSVTDPRARFRAMPKGVSKIINLKIFTIFMKDTVLLRPFTSINQKFLLMALIYTFFSKVTKGFTAFCVLKCRVTSLTEKGTILNSV